MNSIISALDNTQPAFKDLWLKLELKGLGLMGKSDWEIRKKKNLKSDFGIIAFVDNREMKNKSTILWALSFNNAEVCSAQLGVWWRKASTNKLNIE